MAAKGGKAKNMVPRRLAELRKAQLVPVAYSQFGVVLNPNHRLDDLADEVRPLLASVMQCDCAGCRVMSWWDYGYQIAGMANRTTLGKAFSPHPWPFTVGVWGDKTSVSSFPAPQMYSIL